VAGGEVVEAYHTLIKFQEVEAYEAGHFDDQPSFGLVGELGEKFLVSPSISKEPLRV
jgi:hypothetical protein